MKTATIIFLSLIGLNLQSQNYTLAYFKGNLEVMNGGVWTSLNTIGAVVGKNQSVKLADKSEAVFTGVKGETIHLNKPDTYPVTEFQNHVTSSDKSSLSAYYLSFIAHQVTHKESNPEKNYKEQLKNLGGVSRAQQLSLFAGTGKCYLCAGFQYSI
ncbi:MAG: hypothetical protein IPP77_01525 [Bacteroidetes bacterium]|nr:hypothetical protein [Bacteroidota bacterium]